MDNLMRVKLSWGFRFRLAKPRNDTIIQSLLSGYIGVHKVISVGIVLNIKFLATRTNELSYEPFERYYNCLF